MTSIVSLIIWKKVPVVLIILGTVNATLVLESIMSYNEGPIFHEHRNAIHCNANPLKLLDAMAKYEHPHETVKRWVREG